MRWPWKRAKPPAPSRTYPFVRLISCIPGHSECGSPRFIALVHCVPWPGACEVSLSGGGASEIEAVKAAIRSIVSHELETWIAGHIRVELRTP